MATVGKPLGAKLFLEGKEVPFIGATLTHSVGQAAIAYIDLVPHQTINNILPRTLVHLFVRDPSNPSSSFPYVQAFEGEVFGINFGKTPSSRSFSISCIDNTSYWDNVLTYFFNAQQSLGKGAEEVQAVALDQADSAKQGLQTQAVTHSTASYFLQIIKETMATKRADGTKKDFLDGFVAVYQKIAKINDFYSLAESRLKIIDRIRLRSSDNLVKLLDDQQALDWFSGVIGRNSGFSTLRMVIQDLMSIIFHDYTSIPFPATISDSTTTKIAEFVFKPNLYMLPPPACNIFFPDEYSSFNFNRNFFQEPTRLIYKPEMPIFGGGSTSLNHAYEPESFAHFMLSKEKLPDTLKGTDDLQVDTDFGHFDDPNTGESKEVNTTKREQQFLTNEEKMKGILMAQETMVPASSQFRSALSDIGKQQFIKGVTKYLFFKKRFQGRQLQITSQMKMSVVPGFPVLVLDDSDASQNVVAYCSSVTHRIYATQGGYTNTTLSYARTVGEQDIASGGHNEPLVPPWFNKSLFGEVNEDGELVDTSKISDFYKDLLGGQGYQVITDLMKEATLSKATQKLVDQYKFARKKGPDSVDAFISKITRRDYAVMRTAFRVLGAETATKDLLNTDFIEFFGDRLKGKGFADEGQISKRRSVIDSYRNILKSKRGFRG